MIGVVVILLILAVLIAIFRPIAQPRPQRPPPGDGQQDNKYDCIQSLGWTGLDWTTGLPQN